MTCLRHHSPRLRHRQPLVICLALVLILGLTHPSFAATADGQAAPSLSDGYTNYPALNVLMNEEIGSELQFLRGSGRFDGRKLKDYQSVTLELAPDTTYDLAICCHNAAAPTLGLIGVAKDVQLTLRFPCYLTPEQSNPIIAELHSPNTLPETITNRLALTATAPLAIDPDSVQLMCYGFDGSFLAELPAEFAIAAELPSEFSGVAVIGDLEPGEWNGQYVFVEFTTTSMPNAATDENAADNDAASTDENPVSKFFLYFISGCAVFGVALIGIRFLITKLKG